MPNSSVLHLTTPSPSQKPSDPAAELVRPQSSLLAQPLRELGSGAGRFLLATGDIWLFVGAVFAKVFFFSAETGIAFRAWAPWLTLLLLLVLASATLFFRPVVRRAVLFVLGAALSTLIFSDLVYCRYFKTVITTPTFLQAKQVPQVGFCVGELLGRNDLLLAFDTPLWLLLFGTQWFLRRRGIVPPRRMPWRGRLVTLVTFAVLFGLGIRSVYAKDPGLFDGSFNNRGLVEALGLPTFHLYDFYLSVREALFPKEVTPEELEAIESWFAERAAEDGPELVPFGVARGKSVIFIQAESLQGFIIGLKVNGQEITPHLNRLRKESISFERCFDQTAMGRSSDGDFTALNSLHPAARGAVVDQFARHAYHAIPTTLKEHGYYSFATCGMKGAFWNMAAMHRQYGFDRCCYLEDAGPGERFQLGLTDKAFFAQSVPRLSGLPRPFFAQMLTLSCHYPFWFVPDHDKRLQLGELEDTSIGNFLHSAHYADAALGQFFEDLKKAGLYDSSLLVIYGDHDAGQSNQDLAKLMQVTGERWNLATLDRVVLVMRLPHGQYAGERSTVTGHLDIAPSVLHLLGVPRQGTYYLGHNLFRDQGTVVIPFRDGSFADQQYLFVTTNGTFAAGAAYSLDTGELVDPIGCERNFAEARRRLGISDLVLERNLLRRLRERASSR